jgi:hypothetical protein
MLKLIKENVKSLGYSTSNSQLDDFEDLKNIGSVSAFVLRPPNLPLYGTPAFNNFKLLLFIFKWVADQSFETFVYCIAHELAHIVLDSIRHPLRDNELAADLTAMILGFSDIIKSGRKSGNIIHGYLNDRQFTLAYEEIRRQREAIYL